MGAYSLALEASFRKGRKGDSKTVSVDTPLPMGIPKYLITVVNTTSAQGEEGRRDFSNLEYR